MIGLFFGGQWFKSSFGNQYGNIELDAVLEEGHKWSAEVTKNPVEDGAPVTDHVIEQSDELTLRCFVSDTPIFLSQSIEGSVNSSAAGNRTQAVFELLRQLIKAKDVVTVYTKHAIYDDMVIQDISIPRSPGQGEALEFSIDLIHIRRVQTQIVDVPDGISAKKDKKASEALGKKAEPKKDLGKKQATTVDKPSSALSRVFR